MLFVEGDITVLPIEVNHCDMIVILMADTIYYEEQTIMKIKLLTICVITLLCLKNICIIAQQQITVDEAKIAAVRTLSKKQNVKEGVREANINTVNSLDDENHTLMYEVIFDNGWGVLLSGSKACLPVLGYYETKRTQSIFADDVPCGLQDMLENYKQQIALSFANDSIRLYDQKEWRQLLETQLKDSKTNDIRYTGSPVIPPLLTTKWGQSGSNNSVYNPSTGSWEYADCEAYNYYVTESDSYCSCNQKCSAGCTAVALAQVMNYWKYPVYLSNRVDQFDWCNMWDELNTTSAGYLLERHAVARLVKDAGVAAGFEILNDTANLGHATRPGNTLIDLILELNNNPSRELIWRGIPDSSDDSYTISDHLPYLVKLNYK